MHDPLHRQSPAPAPEPEHEALRRSPQRFLPIVGVAGAALAVTVVVTGAMTRVAEADKLKTWTSAEAVPTVAVVSPSSQGGDKALVLPGTVQAYYNAPIYARVSGYVKKWYQDIGAPVHAGQVLAEIDTPELDEQLAQAKANLASAIAAQKLAQTTAARWSKLLAEDAVSKQETDEKTGDLESKTAAVEAAKANVDRLAAERSFHLVTAPFDGVVTARKTDIGALINAGAGGSSSELFDVADVRKVRIYVRVPQAYSAAIGTGMKAEIAVPEYPGRTFSATLAGSADAVNDQSGTVLVQLLADNPKGELKAGDYAQVTFALPARAGQMRLPSSALLYRRRGAEVAVVGPHDRVELKKVTITRDLGADVEIAAGVEPSDRVVNNPPDSLSEGDLVRVKTEGQAHGAA
jgi:RND family efflux transporter MFP subunit